MKTIKRLTPVSRLAQKAIDERIFDSVWYRTSAKGQHGIFVEICRRPYEAAIYVESSRDDQNYFLKRNQPTRISYLSIRDRDLSRFLGIFDAGCTPPTRHRFEGQAKKDPKLKKLLENIFKYFG